MMPTSFLIHFCACIIFFVSAAHAFNVTVGTPTHCDELTVSWIGGEPPFGILLIMPFGPLINVPVPSSAFSNGQGSYTIPQLPLEEGTQFVLSMSDATGFGTGKMTNLLIVSTSIANNSCNTKFTQDFYFSLPSLLMQCGEYFFTDYSNAVQPTSITITVVIPGERFILLHPTSSSYSWIANVEAGTRLIFFMTDSHGRQGGASDLMMVANSTDASCLVGNSPSLTASSPSQSSSQSTSPLTSHVNTVSIVVGVVIGCLMLVLLTTLGIWCKHGGRTVPNLLIQLSDVSRLCLVRRKQCTSAANNDTLAIQQARTLFEKPTGNANNRSFTDYARTCYILHVMLVLIHIMLVVSSIFRWEHRITLPFTSTNDDFWSAVLSVSLQGFYTIYTAILLFLTQRLAISKTLVRRLKLTSIHDISGAWSGLGSALSSVWQQIHVHASWWMTCAIAAYLACVSMLHVTSSSLLQLQTFNTTMPTSVGTALGWPDTNQSNSSNVNWGPITASLQVVNQLPGLISVGISNATVYDIPQTSPTPGTAVVNATTITSRCVLLPNITYNATSSLATYGNSLPVDSGIYAIPPWSGLIQVLPTPDESGIILMVSTSLNIDALVHQEVSALMTWEYTNPAFRNISILYNVSVYFVQCSLSTTTAETLLDMQTNILTSSPAMLIPQPPMQWEIYQPARSTVGLNPLSVASTSSSSSPQLQLCQNALTSSWDTGFYFTDATGNTTTISFVDEYIMGLVGVDFQAQYSQFYNGAPPTPSTFILTPDILESAIAHTVAQLMWIAGRIGSSNGGLDIGKGNADAELNIIALRLNGNLFPLLFATFASVIMLGLALHMTRAFDRDVSPKTQAVIPNTGTLQLLWLGHHSAPVFEVLQDVEHPTDANLRRAGMIDVCFAKTTSDDSEEDRLSTRSSTDRLSIEGDQP